MSLNNVFTTLRGRNILKSQQKKKITKKKSIHLDTLIFHVNYGASIYIYLFSDALNVTIVLSEISTTRHSPT